MAQFRPESKEPNASIARFQAESFSGPLPPPELLIKYNDAVPGAAERILAMAERQSVHRQDLESAVVRANIKSQTRGAYFGFIITMTAILGGVFLILHGKDGQGLAAIIGSLAALTAVFIVGKKREERELAQKSEALAKRANQPR